MGDDKMTQEAKTAVLETKVEYLTSMLEEMQLAHKEMNQKLDSILSLKYKGAGAFALASVLFGTGLFGVLANFFDFFRGH